MDFYRQSIRLTIIIIIIIIIIAIIIIIIITYYYNLYILWRVFTFIHL